MIVFVDTSAWIAIAVKSGDKHQIASAYYLDLLKKRAGLVTSNYVLSETLTRIRYNVSHAKAVELHRIIDQSVKENQLAIHWVDEGTEKEAWTIFEKYDDQHFSIVDCTSLVICKRVGVDEVFAFDDDFKTLGFIVKP